MAQTDTLDAVTTVDPDNRTAVSERLQATLVELIALSLTAKQAHWNVTGPRFIGLHERLDEIVDMARGYADTVAERAATIGVPPSGQAHTVAADSSISPIGEGWIRDDEALTALAERLSVVAERVRERANDLSDLDPVSENVLVDLLGDLEKQTWMLRASR